MPSGAAAETVKKKPRNHRGARGKDRSKKRDLRFLLNARLKRALAPAGFRRTHTESAEETRLVGALLDDLRELAAWADWSPCSPPTPEHGGTPVDTQ